MCHHNLKYHENYRYFFAIDNLCLFRTFVDPLSIKFIIIAGSEVSADIGAGTKFDNCLPQIRIRQVSVLPTIVRRAFQLRYQQYFFPNAFWIRIRIRLAHRYRSTL
jgi:hypothetical protein